MPNLDLPPASARAVATHARLQRAAQIVADRALAGLPSDLTPTRFAVLDALDDAGPLRATDLARRLRTSAANLTFVLGNLERDGLVRREASKEDRRCALVHLTAAGRRKATKVRQPHAERIAAAYASFKAPELKLLGELLARLAPDEPATPPASEAKPETKSRKAR